MMHEIKLPLEFTGKRYGVDFKQGIGQTDNMYIVNIMKKKGFLVTKVSKPLKVKNEPVVENASAADNEPVVENTST